MKKTSTILLSLSALFFAWLPGGGRKAAILEQTPGEYLNARPGVAYVGDEVCRDCHEPQYNGFKKTGMGKSLSLPGPRNWPEFRKRVTVFSKKLGLTYTVSVSGRKMYHTESKIRADGKPEYSERHEVAFTVGSGDLGRSYLVAKGDALFVSPISYYTGIRGWDLSPGYEAGRFRSFIRPAGNLCVSCHSGIFRPIAGTRNRYQNPPFRTLAVGCERCHGPGELHVRERLENAPLRGSIDFSIVNPARLPQDLRDDVCIQCHFGGDARVLQPGKTYMDFRPGTSLGNVVAIFTAPVAVNSDVVKALSHPEQMEMSRCSIQSNGRLGCITCHDPHVQLRGAASSSYFRKKCLTCHTVQSCSLSSTRRQATSPPDNCAQCHMPKKSVANISHSALTDHRILRIASQSPLQVAATPESQEDLIYHPRSGQEPPGAPPDLRTQALAFYEVSQVYPAFRKRGFALLEQAARELPNDPEVQEAYGLVLLVAHPQSPAEAAKVLQKAIDSGSPSVEVRTRLAKIRLREGNVMVARQLYDEAIAADPHYTPAYLGLAYLDEVTGDAQSSIETLERILKYDAGNEEARTALAEAKKSPR